MGQRVRLEGDVSQDPEVQDPSAPAQDDPSPAASDAASEVQVQEAPVGEPKIPVFGDLAGVDEVSCFVPKEIRLHLDNSSSHTVIAPGLQKLPRAVAEHWWCKVSGVEISE